MCPESGFRIAPDWPLIGKMTSMLQFSDITSFSCFVTGPRFMSMSLLVLQLWQFSFMKDWPEIQKPEKTSSEFRPTSGDRDELGIPNFAQISLMKVKECCKMREPQLLPFLSYIREINMVGVKLPPTQIRVKICQEFTLVFFLLWKENW